VKGVDIAIWSCLEINIAIICASVPALKALFIKIIPKLGSLHSSAKRYGNGTNGTLPLHSFDNRDPGASHSDRSDKTGKMEIKVHQSIEMKTLPAEEQDTDSEKNLVTTSWMADCYSHGKDQTKSAEEGRVHGNGNASRISIGGTKKGGPQA
jgi:hypothetical protein